MFISELQDLYIIHKRTVIKWYLFLTYFQLPYTFNLAFIDFGYNSGTRSSRQLGHICHLFQLSERLWLVHFNTLSQPKHLIFFASRSLVLDYNKGILLHLYLLLSHKFYIFSNATCKTLCFHVELFHTYFYIRT
jgi:hypothetical protein